MRPHLPGILDWIPRVVSLEDGPVILDAFVYLGMDRSASTYGGRT